jgi:hypothetical protein
MSVVPFRSATDSGGQGDKIRDDHAARLLTPNGVCHRTGESYAEMIRRHGIVNFVFSYTSGTFHALNKRGEELARGETIRELLDSL